jgi:hypothetical protein
VDTFLIIYTICKTVTSSANVPLVLSLDTQQVSEEHFRMLEAAVSRDKSPLAELSLDRLPQDVHPTHLSMQVVRVLTVPESFSLFLRPGDVLLALNGRCLLDSEAEIAYMLIGSAQGSKTSSLLYFHTRTVRCAVKLLAV